MLVLLVFAASLGIVGFRAPRVVQNQPLMAPIRVVSIDGAKLVLEDKRIIQTEPYSGQDLSNQLSQSDFMVDLEPGAGETVGVYARQTGWICGTPWAQPIRIPIIRDTVYKNRRQLIATGEFIRGNEDSQHPPPN